MGKKYIKIYESECCYGNVMYRACTNQEFVTISKRRSGNLTWEVIYRLPYVRFMEIADRMNIWSPYNQNPAHMLNIIDEMEFI